jgi:hypothetical protein
VVDSASRMMNVDVAPEDCIEMGWVEGGLAEAQDNVDAVMDVAVGHIVSAVKETAQFVPHCSQT